MSFRQGRAPPMICSAKQTTFCRAFQSCCYTRQWCSPSGVEIPQNLRRNPQFPQVSEGKQSLPCLSHHRVSMQCPGQALGDVDTKVLEAVHPLHRGPTDGKRGVVPPLLLPKVHYHLLSHCWCSVGGCCPETSGSDRHFHCYLWSGQSQLCRQQTWRWCWSWQCEGCELWRFLSMVGKL